MKNPARAPALSRLLCLALCAIFGACDCGGTDPSADTGVIPDTTLDAVEDPSDTAEDISRDLAGDTGPDIDEDAPDSSDGGEDVGDTAEANAPRSIVFTSSGGGVVHSENQRAVIGIGAPQPAGSSQSDSNDLTTGPGAARP